MLQRQLDQDPDLTIKEYMSNQLGMLKHSDNVWLVDFYEVIETSVAQTYGQHIASRCRADLVAHPMILTANHHGIDTFCDSVQATLLFAFWKLGLVHKPSTITVLACSSINLDNSTGPAGFRVHDTINGPLEKARKQFRILPASQKACMVSKASPFTSDMLRRSSRAVADSARGKMLSNMHCKAAQAFIDEVLDRRGVLSLPAYLEQAREINKLLWHRLFRTPIDAPDLIFLDLESISAALVCRDLAKSDSLLTLLLLDSSIFRKLLRCLNGAPACWNVDVLRESRPGGGTVMFWGVGPLGRRFPLSVDNNGDLCLVGKDELGGTYRIFRRADELCDLLAEGRIVPSLVTCFTVLALQRGLSCVGGYFQAEYLPAMQRGILATLWQTNSLPSTSALEKVDDLVLRSSVAALQPIVQRDDIGQFFPAGPIEIAASGGLSASDIKTCLDVPVVEATQFALLELGLDLVRDDKLSTNIVSQLAHDLALAPQRSISFQL